MSKTCCPIFQPPMHQKPCRLLRWAHQISLVLGTCLCYRDSMELKNLSSKMLQFGLLRSWQIKDIFEQFALPTCTIACLLIDTWGFALSYWVLISILWLPRGHLFFIVGITFSTIAATYCSLLMDSMFLVTMVLLGRFLELRLVGSWQTKGHIFILLENIDFMFESHLGLATSAVMNITFMINRLLLQWRAGSSSSTNK